MKKILAYLLVISIVFAMTGCAGETASNGNDSQYAKTDEKITIRFFSNLPDRSTGQGKLEQMIMDNYCKENPNVTFEVETLDDVSFSQKLKAYIASNNLPDMLYVNSLPAEITPLLNSNALADLSEEDYENYDFIQGALDGYKFDGKLYGLPRNTDFMVLYYNQALFDQYDLDFPTNLEELKHCSEVFLKNGIIPCSLSGQEQWPLALYFQEVILKTSGNQQEIYDAVDRKIQFSGNDNFIKAIELMQELTKSNFAQEGFAASEYGAAMNLFTQGKAAMYYMGEWDMGMATDETLPEEFRENVRAGYLPAFTENGKNTDLVAWYGGGYGVSANSKLKDECIKFLNYLMKPENWAKLSWENGLNFPAQDATKYVSDNDSQLQKDLVEILANASSTSGVDFYDSSTSEFMTACMSICQNAVSGNASAEECLAELDKAADTAKSDMEK
ncbi:extracellular solute-binding protein [Lachnospiraceae bacterium ASD3451]|uniref:ABC transporter substrate-binding protein n=1 Tax=Diplocloster agilis TaxID=2850323 RepID=UPI001D4FBB89|nr:extracellular solute-binding protein [Diplocloster agilis]MBU9744556.1 extracellular solute-binding protein [Diplocloster agilis]